MFFGRGVQSQRPPLPFSVTSFAEYAAAASLGMNASVLPPPPPSQQQQQVAPGAAAPATPAKPAAGRPKETAPASAGGDAAGSGVKRKRDE